MAINLERGFGDRPLPPKQEYGNPRSMIIGELAKSVHGKLEEYVPVIGEACNTDPEFLAHLIAWDYVNGEVKDSKVALPVLTLVNNDFPDALVENSLAHIALQPARELLKVMEYARKMGAPARRQRRLERVAKAWLTEKEKIEGKWARSVARQRRAFKGLYCITRRHPPNWVGDILYGFHRDSDGDKVPVAYEPGSIFAAIAHLAKMPANLAAATIQKWHLSPLVVDGAMTGAKDKLKDSAVVQAGIAEMTGNEMLNRAKTTARKAGVDEKVKAAMRNRVAKMATRSTLMAAAVAPVATLKTSVAAEEVEDAGTKAMLRELQERQIEAAKVAGKGVIGNVLVIVDRSGSQEHAIEFGKHVAAHIAKYATGNVGLVFCNTEVAGYTVTGNTLEKILEKAMFVRASGGTSYGVGLQWGAKEAWDVIAVVGDGAENRAPQFAVVYGIYSKAMGKTPPVYLYKTRSTNESELNCLNFERTMEMSGHPVKVFPMTGGQVDYFSLPNLVQTMSGEHFGVIEKIMACPLVKLEQVLPGYAEKGAALRA